MVTVKGQRRRVKLCRGCLGERLQVVPAEDGAQGREHDAVKEPDHNYCGAKRTRNGGTPCTQPAGWGTEHVGIGPCKLHGGSTSAHVARAAKVQAQMHAVTMGAPVDIDPHEALLWCVRTAAGEVAYCNAMVAAIDPDAATGAQLQRKVRPLKGEYGEESMSQLAEEKTYTDPRLHIWITTRHGALERLAKFSKMALDAGVAERQVQLAEQWADVLGQAIGNILVGLKLTSAQQQLAPELVRANLAVLEGTAKDAE